MAVKKTITYRWFVYGFSMIAAALLIAAIGLVALLYNFYYQSVSDVLENRADLYRRSTFFADADSETWDRMAPAYVEKFEHKEQMQLQVLSSRGAVLASSNGFIAAGNDLSRDFQAALSADGKGVVHTGRNSTGEHIMSYTQIQTDDAGAAIGALRLVVTLRFVDRQIAMNTLLIGLIVLLILFFTALSSFYFIRSIVHPVEEIGRAARRIAQGNYDYRIEKHSQDEIGQLGDTINYMAGEIQRAEQLKNDFISSVSHELRTPLTAIRGWNETLQQIGPDDPELVQKGMQIIADETDRLSGMVEELLDFSRMQSGKLTLRFDRMDVAAVLEETVLLFRERAEKKGVYLQVVGDGRLPKIEGDADRLRQVFINVLDNAIKYSDAGDTVRVDSAAMDRFVQIVIGDTGSGISEEDLPRVKQKFYKANTTRPGSGIGLAVADEIVAGHGGTLELHSKKDLGTSVIITLPVNRPDNGQKGKGQE